MSHRTRGAALLRIAGGRRGRSRPLSTQGSPPCPARPWGGEGSGGALFLGEVLTDPPPPQSVSFSAAERNWDSLPRRAAPGLRSSDGLTAQAPPRGPSAFPRRTPAAPGGHTFPGPCAPREEPPLPGVRPPAKSTHILLLLIRQQTAQLFPFPLYLFLIIVKFTDSEP